jgi:hypothetical protein
MGEGKRIDKDLFNYKSVRLKYLLMLSNYYKHATKRNNINIRPLNKKEYAKVIKLITDAKTINTPAKLTKNLLNKYEVVENVEDGVKSSFLIDKQTKKEVLCCEDSFDVVVKAHVKSGHGCRSKTIKALPQSVFISKACISTLLKVCNVCRDRKGMLKIGSRAAIYNKTCHLFTTTVPFEGDHKLAGILIVVDKYTNYFHIRPLYNLLVSDTGIELYKIC